MFVQNNPRLAATRDQRAKQPLADLVSDVRRANVAHYEGREQVECKICHGIVFTIWSDPSTESRGVQCLVCGSLAGLYFMPSAEARWEGK